MSRAYNFAAGPAAVPEPVLRQAQAELLEWSSARASVMEISHRGKLFMNPRRIGLLQALRAMGADIRQANSRELGGEAVADLVVRHAPLRGIDVPLEIVADMCRTSSPARNCANASMRPHKNIRYAADPRGVAAG